MCAASLSKDVVFQLPRGKNNFFGHRSSQSTRSEHHEDECCSAGLRVLNNFKAATLETSPSMAHWWDACCVTAPGKIIELSAGSTFNPCREEGGLFRKSGLVVPYTTRPPSKNSSEVTCMRTQCASPFLRSKASDTDSTSAPLTHYPEVGSVLCWRGRVLSSQRRVALHALPVIIQATFFAVTTRKDWSKRLASIHCARRSLGGVLEGVLCLTIKLFQLCISWTCINHIIEVKGYFLHFRFCFFPVKVKILLFYVLINRFLHQISHLKHIYSILQTNWRLYILLLDFK